MFPIQCTHSGCGVCDSKHDDYPGDVKIRDNCITGTALGAWYRYIYVTCVRCLIKRNKKVQVFLTKKKMLHVFNSNKKPAGILFFLKFNPFYIKEAEGSCS